nr:ammonia channel protein [Burkholderiaceae bacterium]
MNRIVRMLALVAALCLAPLGGAIAADTGPTAAQAAPILLAQADAKKDEAPAAKAEAAPAAEEKKAEAAAAETPVPNKGDTTWMLVSTALVVLMTIPGLALFYGGLVRSKNMLS